MWITFEKSQVHTAYPLKFPLGQWAALEFCHVQGMGLTGPSCTWKACYLDWDLRAGSTRLRFKLLAQGIALTTLSCSPKEPASLLAQAIFKIQAECSATRSVFTTAPCFWKERAISQLTQWGGVRAQRADKRMKAERNQFPGFDPEGKKRQGQEPYCGPEPRHEAGCCGQDPRPASQGAQEDSLCPDPQGPPSFGWVEEVLPLLLGLGTQRG